MFSVVYPFSQDNPDIEAKVQNNEAVVHFQHDIFRKKLTLCPRYSPVEHRTVLYAAQGPRVEKGAALKPEGVH